MAEALISSMTGEFDPSEFTDDYREAMTALLEAKQSGGEVQQVPEVPDEGAAVVDLMSALRRSVEKARGGSSDEASDAAEKPAARRAPAKKAASDEPPAKKAPAKKAAPAAAKKAAPATSTAAKATAAKKTADKPPAKRARRSA